MTFAADPSVAAGFVRDIRSLLEPYERPDPDPDPEASAGP